jgi:hypothetical protein
MTNLTNLTSANPDHAIADQAEEISKAVRRLRKRVRKEFRKLRRDPLKRARRYPLVTGATLAGAVGLAAAAALLISRAARRD